MMTDAINDALENEHLGPEHWDLTDEQLLDRLHTNTELDPTAREAVRRFAVADFYRPLFLGWYDGVTADDLRRPEWRKELQAALSRSTSVPCSTYVYYDRGTFEKALRLRVRDRTGGVSDCTFGSKSVSTVVAVATRRRDVRMPARQLTRRIQGVLSDFGLDPASIRRQPGVTFNLS